MTGPSDLDLLRETDPTRQRDFSTTLPLVERLQLLENLRLLESSGFETVREGGRK
jgi:hypothetical protein